jgi:hypothetical protein
MAEKTRQEWLATFLSLIDSKAPSIQYRRLLGIQVQQLPAHVQSIQSYREELAALNAAAAPNSRIIPTVSQLKAAKEKRENGTKEGK